ncbi:carbon-nitrogen hydrolase family protein [Jeongeupia naejangsanensis]|uniref:Carbon-nitrogen hydrolase family protein n=1 Tax=Jeongeupia naejangsanensis TaxID=613195 RepID=A0ABS2BN75_9NEIS|nr:carbon-nitrogen hydrolase family protein [Jeongeupia naejangsanensis]MBM3117075.1 carbon-nitrogen hydrolase family protein [Jeongeupia naejangsanensis]
MTMLRIAAAQSISVPGDVSRNVATHIAFARAAAAESVSFLIFPELSLSGYEPALLHKCTLTPCSELLQPLRQIAANAKMTIAFGAPVESESGSVPSIGSINFHADGSTTVYRKRFLHPGEDTFAVPGLIDSHCVDIDKARVALAICADTTHPEHARSAAAAGATLYAAGVLWSKAGYAVDAEMVKSHALAHGFGVLVANHGGPTGGFVSGGKSSFWAGNGELVVRAPDEGNALVIASKVADQWRGSCRLVDA